MASLSPDLFRFVRLYMRKRRKGVHLCVCQVQSSLLTGALGGGVGAQSRNVRACPERLSCFRRATEGRRCYCWEGPEGPGTTAARPGWPALEGAVRRKEPTFSQDFTLPISPFSRTHIHPTIKRCFQIFTAGQDSRLTMARACRTPPGCPNCWRKG